MRTGNHKKMQTRGLILLATFLAVSLGLQTAHAEQVTANGYEDSFPHIKGKYVVWQEYVGGDWEVLVNNMTSGQTTQITDNSYNDVSPQTDGRYVVWRGDSHSAGEIFLHDISSGQTIQLTNDDRVDSPPQIADGFAVWTAREVTDSVEAGEIFVHDTATGQTLQVTNNDLEDSAPRIHEKRVIFVQADGNGNKTVYSYDPTSPLGEDNPAPVEPGFVWEDTSRRDGDLTVLSRHDGNDKEIFVHSTESQIYEQVTNNDFDDKYPVISGNNIVWVGREGRNAEIFMTAYGPSIDKVRPRSLEPGGVFRIVGTGFGDTQGESVVHINAKIYDSSSPKIKLWSDSKIKMIMPFGKNKCSWFKDGGGQYRKRKLWVTVGGMDSNKKKILVDKPGTCP